MERDQTARVRIRERLTTDGPVVDASGHAIARLMGLIGYTGSPANFARLVVVMNRDGEILLDAQGAHVHSISIASRGHGAAPPSAIADLGYGESWSGLAERQAYLRQLRLAHANIDVLFGRAPQNPSALNDS